MDDQSAGTFNRFPVLCSSSPFLHGVICMPFAQNEALSRIRAVRDSILVLSQWDQRLAVLERGGVSIRLAPLSRRHLQVHSCLWRWKRNACCRSRSRPFRQQSVRLKGPLGCSSCPGSEQAALPSTRSEEKSLSLAERPLPQRKSAPRRREVAQVRCRPLRRLPCSVLRRCARSRRSAPHSHDLRRRLRRIPLRRIRRWTAPAATPGDTGGA